MLENIKHIVNRIKARPLKPAKAYDIWADCYDLIDDNLVFKMEKEILDSLLKEINLRGKAVLDYGCGTGRNWERVISQSPGSLTGCDVSPKMLGQLEHKFPDHRTFLLNENPSLPLESGTIDFILSTLVIAHIKDISKVLTDWERLLRLNGNILLTDLHPAVLLAGGKRTFEKSGRTYEIKNYIHSIEKIKTLCGKLNMEVIGYEERIISKDSKYFYEARNALHVYERFFGLPLVYGMLLRKAG